MVSFDSTTLKNWIDENKCFLTGARIQKIQQPTRRDFIFSLRNNGETKKLYININPQFYHACFMNKANEDRRFIEIPQKPPMFCMLLRKYLESAVISRVNQPEYERILEFYIETFNELSEKIYLCLAVEFMGKHSNVILYNYDTNMILGCAHNVGSEKSREREMAGGLPYVYPSGRPTNWYECENTLCGCDINSKIDDYFAKIIGDDKLKRQKDSLRQVVNRKLKKDKTSLKKMEYQLDKEFDGDKYRVFGNMIMSNLYNNKDYVESIKVLNYETGKDVLIELDSSKTLKENANNYYKLYNKSKTAVMKLGELSENLRENIAYYEQTLYSIDIAETISELNEIKNEIMPEKISKVSEKSSLFPEEIDIDGCKVFLGKNNRQNDYIVSKLSKDDDWWFHTRDCAGSHVLLRCANPSESLIFKCAKLAKEFSKGSKSSKVGVIYTRCKFLKKPPKANPGYVIYKNEQEIIID